MDAHGTLDFLGTAMFQAMNYMSYTVRAMLHLNRTRAIADESDPGNSTGDHTRFGHRRDRFPDLRVHMAGDSAHNALHRM